MPIGWPIYVKSFTTARLHRNKTVNITHEKKRHANDEDIKMKIDKFPSGSSFIGRMFLGSFGLFRGY